MAGSLLLIPPCHLVSLKPLSGDKEASWARDFLWQDPPCLDCPVSWCLSVGEEGLKPVGKENTSLCHVLSAGFLVHPFWGQDSCSIQGRNEPTWAIFLKFILFYLFLAALGLHWCTRVFSSCGEQRLLFIVVRGPLIVVASLVAEHGL